jgi:hypothetical protein
MAKSSTADSLIAFGKVSFLLIRLTSKLLAKDDKLVIGSSFVGDDDWIEDLCNAVLNAAKFAEQSTHYTTQPMNSIHSYSWAYETLSIPDTSTEQEVKSAFKSLVKQYHPDINKSPDATKKYIDVVKAYQILSTA